MKVKDLKKNERNPRTISQEKKAGLKKSVEKFGDLGGIIFNVRSKRLVGGHQRSSVLSPTDSIRIDKKYEEPTKTGTVAEGYVIHDGEKYAYREVDWDKTRETEAMLAANKHSGSWDNDLLKVAFADVGDLSITGFDIPELKALDIAIPTISIDVPAPVKEVAKAAPDTTEQIPTASPSENTKVAPKTFEEEEEAESPNMEDKRHVIIIGCDDDAHKQSLRDKLRPLIEETGAKIF